MSRRALLLAALVVLAGCEAPLRDEPRGDATPSRSLTPVAVPNGTLAPGVTEAGIVDLSALVSAHREAYADGVARTFRHRQTWANGTTRHDVRRRVVSNGSCRRYLVEVTITAGPQAPRDLSMYANGTHVVQRRDRPGWEGPRLLTGPTGEPFLPCSVRVLEPNGDERLYSVLGGHEFDVDPAGDRVRLTASNVALPAVSSGLDPVRNVTADVEVVVTTGGAIRRLRVDYRGETDGGPVRGVIVDRFEPADGVERPAWAANATR